MSSGPDDLGRFGFDDPAESWVDRFREVEGSEGGHVGSIGPYEVVEEIARGGQGVVYRARQPGLERELAIKRLRSGISSKTGTGSTSESTRTTGVCPTIRGW